ncbi:SWIM zinc finger family protein [Fodinicurvata sediminis]|uniref:SWIM zinc finger family protein n=1 Tax=Fodinicurvata sediminis TaxID=1121832 RepID=UPI0003B35671|nr:DUF6880 family protein [Fodinicurvata sediminis]
MYCDTELLKELAGPKVFARGEEYFRNGCVVLLSLEETQIWARVYGSEVYETLLDNDEDGLDGECSCPAFEDWGFCKHMVAVGLAANAAPETPAGPSGLSDIREIRRSLQDCSHEALVKLVADFAEYDVGFFRMLRRRLQLMPSEEPEAEVRLRSHIEVSLHLLHAMEDRHDDTGYRELCELISSLEDWVAQGQATAALRLSGHLIDRLLEEMDDYAWASGDCGALIKEAARVNLMACELAAPDPVELASDIFGREMKGAYFGSACGAAFYVEVLGKAGLAEYRRLAEEAWQKTPAKAPVDRSWFQMPDRQDGRQLFRLIAIKDYLGELDGDVDARIAARKRDLSSIRKYQELVRFCLEQGRPAEALGYLEEGLWVFPEATSHRNQALDFCDLLERLGQKARGIDLLLEAFSSEPDEQIYGRLAHLGGEAAAEKAVADLRARLREEQGFKRSRMADVLLRILMGRQDFEQAWTVAVDNKLPAASLMKLAKASEAAYPDRARAVYEQEVERLVNSGGNENYRNACGLISRLEKLQSPNYHKEYVEGLVQRYRRKRNFMKLLEQRA